MAVNTVSSQVDARARRGDAPPPYSPHAPDVITTEPGTVQHLILIEAPLRRKPIFYTCPHCNKRVYTKVEYISSNKTHLCAGFLCGLTCWCFICCVGALPYYFNTFKKVNHYCPICEKLLGTY